MKSFLSLLSLMSLLVLLSSCLDNNGTHTEEVRDDDDIQREEVLRSDDIRESDSYEHTVPINTDKDLDPIEEE